MGKKNKTRIEMVKERQVGMQKDHIKQLLSVTLTEVVFKVGFMSEAHGNLTKEILKGDDIVEMLGLGATLDCCLKEKNYKALALFAKQVKERREKGYANSDYT